MAPGGGQDDVFIIRAQFHLFYLLSFILLILFIIINVHAIVANYGIIMRIVIIYGTS